MARLTPAISATQATRIPRLYGTKAVEVVYWASARYGQRDHGSWGREYDIMAAFLTQDAYDAFTLSKEEYELAKELKDAEADVENEDTQDAPLEVDWDGLDDRTVRLTKDSANITQSYLNKDASKLYFLKRHASGSELWVREFREDNTKLLRKLDRTATFEFTTRRRDPFRTLRGETQPRFS